MTLFSFPKLWDLVHSHSPEHASSVHGVEAHGDQDAEQADEEDGCKDDDVDLVPAPQHGLFAERDRVGVVVGRPRLLDPAELGQERLDGEQELVVWQGGAGCCGRSGELGHAAGPVEARAVLQQRRAPVVLRPVLVPHNLSESENSKPCYGFTKTVLTACSFCDRTCPHGVEDSARSGTSAGPAAPGNILKFIRLVVDLHRFAHCDKPRTW